jgi:phosphoribosylglycinamide formyltransferase-1
LPDEYRVAVLVSGTGTNLQAILDRVHADPDSNVSVVLVVASKDDVPALGRAKAAGVETAVVGMGGRERAERDAELADVVAGARPDLVVLAGWMSIVTNVFLDRFPDRVINLHPSLLPAFPGMNSIEDAYEWGVRVTGVTVHFAEEHVDAGPPILQATTPVLYADSPDDLRAKVRELEHDLLPRAIRAFARGGVTRHSDNPRRIEVVEEDE